MEKITLGGNPVHIKGNLPKVGEKAPDFEFVKQDMSTHRLYEIEAKAKVIIAVPSLDTPVCANETRAFNQKLSNLNEVKGIVISKDLPFAMKRFCETNDIKNVESASDFRSGAFTDTYGLTILEGAFTGITARAIFVLDAANTIVYSELVSEVGKEPDYDKALEAVNGLL
ncbi:MAG: thiol peroxidase [Luteibaculaceae bacterium]